jgi:hypothetical protein
VPATSTKARAICATISVCRSRWTLRVVVPPRDSADSASVRSLCSVCQTTGIGEHQAEDERRAERRQARGGVEAECRGQGQLVAGEQRDALECGGAEAQAEQSTGEGQQQRLNDERARELGPARRRAPGGR